MKTFSAKPLSLISLLFDALLAQQGPESAQAGSHPQGSALARVQKAVADVCTSPRVPGLFGWAGCVHRQLMGPPARVQPHPLPALVLGLGTHRGCGRSEAPCEGSGLGAGH